MVRTTRRDPTSTLRNLVMTPLNFNSFRSEINEWDLDHSGVCFWKCTVQYRTRGTNADGAMIMLQEYHLCVEGVCSAICER